MLIDTHVHVSAADAARFPTLPLPADRTPWWVDPMPLDRLLGEMDRVGVDRTVLVHAFGAYGSDNRYVLSVAGLAPERTRVAYGADMATPHAVDDVEERAWVPGVAAVRALALGAEPDPWLSDGRANALWDAAAALGASVIVCGRAPGLRQLWAHVAARPEVAVVLDDCGVPDLDGDRIPTGHPIFNYIDLPHVSVKVFSPMLLAAAAVGSPAHLVDQVVGAFGPDRVAWGSNFPQSGVAYPTLVTAALEATRQLAPSARDAVLGATAERLWFGARRAGS